MPKVESRKSACWKLSMPTPRASKGRSGWLNIEITRIGLLMAGIKISGIRRWERLGIGFFYILVMAYGR